MGEQDESGRIVAEERRRTGCVRQDLTQRRRRIRGQRHPLADRILGLNQTALRALRQHQRRERLGEIRDVVRRVRPCARVALDVGEAKAGFPHDLSVLHDRGGQSGNARLNAQRFDVALEQGEGEALPTRARLERRECDHGKCGDLVPPWHAFEAEVGS